MQYELEMVATDSVNEASTKVVIKINDVNDRPPVFDQTIYEAELEEEFTSSLPVELLKVWIENHKQKTAKERIIICPEFH